MKYYITDLLDKSLPDFIKTELSNYYFETKNNNCRKLLNIFGLTDFSVAVEPDFKNIINGVIKKQITYNNSWVSPINLKQSTSSIHKILKNCKSSKSLKLVFSTDPWDIATMSMRGIKSCMRWNSKMAVCLIGSILCPFTGIVYLTNKKPTKYGEKMLFRSLVRVIFNPKQNCYKIFIDEGYPKVFNPINIYNDYLPAVSKMFVELVKENIFNSSNLMNCKKQDIISTRKLIGYKLIETNQSKWCMDRENDSYIDNPFLNKYILNRCSNYPELDLNEIIKNEVWCKNV